MNNIKTHIQTDNLTAIIYNDGDMKLEIYNKYKSPYGWSPRELIASYFGVEANEFTYDYVSNKVDEVYSTFPNKQIHELLNKVKQYNDSKEN
tara:strand:- start:150 stop:425 length:276 start_codon:yes stop_codon:yes gene_type:complete